MTVTREEEGSRRMFMRILGERPMYLKVGDLGVKLALPCPVSRWNPDYFFLGLLWVASVWCYHYIFRYFN